MGSPADNSAVYSTRAEAAKTGSVFRNFAPVDAQAAGNAVHEHLGGLGQVVSPSTPLVDLFDFRPDKVQNGPEYNRHKKPMVFEMVLALFSQ